MTTQIQYELFEEVNERFLEEKRLDECEKSLDRLRKSQFARLGDMAKELLKYKRESEINAFRNEQEITKLKKEVEAMRDLLISVKK